MLSIVCGGYLDWGSTIYTCPLIFLTHHKLFSLFFVEALFQLLHLSVEMGHLIYVQDEEQQNVEFLFFPLPVTSTTNCGDTTASPWLYHEI